MNIKRILAISLVAFIVCLAFVGVVSAFTVTQDAKSTPSGALLSGETVTTTLQIKLTKDELDMDSALDFQSDLESVTCNVDIYKDGGAYVTSATPSSTSGRILGFDLSGYGGDLLLNIKQTGTVSTSSAGGSISPLTVSVLYPNVVSGYSTYSAPKQTVYNTANLAGDLQTLQNEITSLEASINEYVAAGYDCSEAKAKLEIARSKYQSAKAAGTDKSAFTNCDAGMAAIDEARKSLAGVTLSVILTYKSSIDDIVTELKSNGWNNEAALVDNHNLKIGMSYDTYLKDYQNGNVNQVDLDNLRIETIDLYNEANTYLEKSQNVFGGIMGILPYILIVVGVIVVGVIVFFLIRRRKNSWDELG